MEKMWDSKMDPNDPLYRDENEGLVAWMEKVAQLDKISKELYKNSKPSPVELNDILEEAFKASMKKSTTRPNRL